MATRKVFSGTRDVVNASAPAVLLDQFVTLSTNCAMLRKAHRPSAEAAEAPENSLFDLHPRPECSGTDLFSGSPSQAERGDEHYMLERLAAPDYELFRRLTWIYSRLATA